MGLSREKIRAGGTEEERKDPKFGVVSEMECQHAKSAVEIG